MNKKIIISLALVLSFSFFGNFVSAAPNTSILPTSPFYFFKDLGRQIQDFFTIDDNKKVELRLNIAEEKLNEIKKIAELNPNNPNYEKYLKDYEKAVEKAEKNIANISSNKEELLETIILKIIEQEQKLEELKNIIRSDKKDAINEVKNNILNAYIGLSLKIADEETAQNKIEERIQSMDKDEVASIISGIEGNASENLINILNKIDIAQEIKRETLTENMEYRVNRDAASLGLTPEEILQKVETFSKEDKAKLEQYALEILTNKAEKDVNEINLSLDALQKIESLKNTAIERTQGNAQLKNTNQEENILGLASQYCIRQGNKTLIEKDENQKEVRLCISKNGKKCNELDYFNKKCFLE